MPPAASRAVSSHDPVVTLDVGHHPQLEPVELAEVAEHPPRHVDEPAVGECGHPSRVRHQRITGIGSGDLIELARLREFDMHPAHSSD